MQKKKFSLFLPKVKIAEEQGGERKENHGGKFSLFPLSVHPMRETIHHFSCLKICQYFQSLNNIFVLLTNRYFVSVRKRITETRSRSLNLIAFLCLTEWFTPSSSESFRKSTCSELDV